jgi:predicted HTH domain antitoxin
MALEKRPIWLDPTENEVFEELCRLGEWSEAEASTIIIQIGLAGLRLETALQLYQRALLSTGEIAERAGINRGVLLEAIHQRHLSPAPDPMFDPVAYQKDTEHWLKTFQEQWPGLR